MDFEKILLSLKEGGIVFLSTIVCAFSFLVNPIVCLIYPPIEEFTPVPESAPAAVEKHSIADYSIVYGPDASPAEVNAANILAATLSEITGLPYAAAEAAAPSDANEILVGQISGVDVSQAGTDGYVIEARGESIAIAGGGSRGVLYGVYHFLQKYFDCRWYTANLRVIPKGPAEIAAVENEQFAPPIPDFRDTDWMSCSDLTFSVANGLNGNPRRGGFSAEWGGSYGYVYGSSGGYVCHTMPGMLIPYSFFTTNKEWFAYREDTGERQSTQLCLTNPDMRAEMIREVRALLARNGGQPVSEQVIISVTQADNEEYCQCEKCKAVDAEEGSHAGTMIRFINAIAEDVAEDYPWALIDTFAYTYTRTPPKITKPLPNVIVRLCSIECCFAHPLDDPNCPDNAAFVKDIEGWRAICDNLYIWDYTTNYMHFNCVFPNLHVLQKNMQFFARHDIKGIYEEGNYTRQGDTDFGHLRAYLLARLMYNPDIDYEAEMNGFLKAQYGGGWQYVHEFIDFTSQNTGKPDWLGRHRRLAFYMTPTDKGILDLKPNQIAYADKLWEKAAELAGDETCKQNVLASQVGWRYWKACNRKSEFSWLHPVSEWTGENERLYNDLKALGCTYRSEGVLFTQNPSWHETPIDWRD